MTCQCTCHKPVRIDYDSIERDMMENGIRESEWGPITFFPENWPQNKSVPQDMKQWLHQGLADGSVVLGGHMDPRFEL